MLGLLHQEHAALHALGQGGAGTACEEGQGSACLLAQEHEVHTHARTRQ